MHGRWFDKGNISSLISLSVLMAGLGGRAAAIPGSDWVLAAGLFGLAGGMTNWLAVKMLFDRVPLLYGSGVIPMRFREIRAQVREMIMRHFFDVEYLRRYLAERGGSLQVVRTEDLRARLQRLVRSPEVEAAIAGQVESVLQSPFGMVLQIVGAERIRKVAWEFVEKVGLALEQPLRRELNSAAADPAAWQKQVDRLVAAKLEELTPQTVKRMMEEVIRAHLGWLVVWGNVFGGLVGLVSVAFGYAVAGGR